MWFAPDPEQKKQRLTALRTAMKAANISGFVVPRTDDYQNEYIPEYAQRLTWLCGFTGSAGLGLVLDTEAALFVDGRYTLQAPEQVDTELWHVLDYTTKQTPMDWVHTASGADLKLAYDPWLHTPTEINKFQKQLDRQGGTLVPLSENIIDTLWTDQPSPPQTPIVTHPLPYSGQSSLDKRQYIGRELEQAGQDAALISDPASIAWLLNVRATDVPCTPLPLSRAIIEASGTTLWFVDSERLPVDIHDHVGPGVTVYDPDALVSVLEALAQKTIRLSPDLTPQALFTAANAAHVTCVHGPDPCSLPRARKNQIEIKGSAAAHQRDGVAMAKFLYWLDQTISSGQDTTELDAEVVLTGLRQKQELFQDISFEPISGAGPHGAIVHYRATEASNRTIDRDSLYLIDAGGQYLDGTTDITRTIATGTICEEMRQRYTEVLVGHITLARQRFPAGTTGAALDTLARAALWQSGMDYNHGTGHGVGSYLGVHEGPQRLSKTAPVKLQPGMILSNEPGYYKTDAFGIRIENLVLVRSDKKSTDENEMLAFETLTCAPIDTRPIIAERLSAADRKWLNTYHAWVRLCLSPHLSDAEAGWLGYVTQPI